MQGKTEIYRKIIVEKFTDLENIDEVLLELKVNGASQFDCVKLLRIELQIPLSQADEIVLNSTAWKEFKEGNLKLQALFWDSLENNEDQK